MMAPHIKQPKKTAGLVLSTGLNRNQNLMVIGLRKMFVRNLKNIVPDVIFKKTIQVFTP